MSIGGWADHRPGSLDLHRLRLVAVGLPVVFLFALEGIRVLFLHRLVGFEAGYVVVLAVELAAVVGFALAMFALIERAQRDIERRNRELAAINAVSTAVQGELGVSEIIDAALRTVLDSTPATEASVAVFPPEGHSEDEGLVRQVAAQGRAPGGPTPRGTVPALIDIPLSTGTSVVGRLRLHLAPDAAEPDLLASATLQNIGHQLACAIEMGQLLDDLQRRKHEGHGLYDVLLQISNQQPLGDILAAVATHARDLLGSDEAAICLTETTVRSGVTFAGSHAPLTLGGGTVCITAGRPTPGTSHTGHPACPVRSDPSIRQTMDLPLPSPQGSLGDLWIGRRSDVAYTGRDRGYLRTLAELAAIAVTNARMRENERQGAIVAERERIAREMHDSLAQVLGVTHLRLRALGGRAEVRTAPTVEQELRELADLSEEAYRDVREAILGLREASRTDRGLIAGLTAYLEKYAHQAGLAATLESSLDGEPPLAPRAEVQVIRVIQEALTNVRKHAHASSVVVGIRDDGQATRIVIRDDGRGFDLAGELLGRDGFGLHTMRERMELVGGALAIASRPGAGTTITATIPHAAPVTVTSVTPSEALVLAP